jgi:signal transduction histidine kinase
VRQPDGHLFLLELVADITEQERLRVRLIETEQLAAAGELAAGVAHEIRNPLSAIVNATTLLEREAMLTAEERASILEAVKKEARRLNATLADFLSFARPQEPKRIMGDIREVVEHVATLLHDERTPADGVQVDVWVDPVVPPCAFDPAQLTQVLWNIALNGVKAMDGHGRLRLEVGRQGSEVWIAVCDTGPGISPEEQRRVFQPFFSKRPGGTGLGLAIARRIVMAHAGHIDVESVPGQGSRFTIRLPLVEV